MKRQLKVLFTVIVLMLSGISLSYAAFPVASHNTPNVASGATTSSTGSTIVQQEEQSTTSIAKTPVKPDGKSSGKSQVIALILCALVGCLGIHRFYLGYTWQGVVQLLTGGGCGIWALIDLIRIITGDLQPKNGKYAKTL